MRILITGSRDWYDLDMAERVVLRLMVKAAPAPILIVHGACETGVDKAFADAAENCGVETEAHPAQWSLGKRAGPLRNAEMVAMGADLCVAFSRNIASSRGTAGCARLAIEAGIPTYLCEDETATPQRLEPDDPRLRLAR